MNRWGLPCIVIFLLLGILLGIFLGMFTTPKWPPEQKQAIEVAREYLEDVGGETGKVLSVQLVHRDEVRDGNLFYWQRAKGFEVPDMPEPEWCWVVRFEQGLKRGHWLEVLIDLDTGEVTGYASCR